MTKFKNVLREKLHVKLYNDYPYLPYVCKDGVAVEGVTVKQLGNVGFMVVTYYDVIVARKFIDTKLNYFYDVYDVEEYFTFDSKLKDFLAIRTSHMVIYNNMPNYAVCFDNAGNVNHILYSRKGF